MVPTELEPRMAPQLVWTCLTYSTEQSPSSKTNRFSADPEIPCILRNLKVHYRIYKSPPFSNVKVVQKDQSGSETFVNGS
jgi:hypothetical protein